MTERWLEPPAEIEDLETTLRAVAHGARVVGLGWMTVLAVVTATGDVRPESPAVAWGYAVLGAVWAIAATLGGQRAKEGTVSVLHVSIDLVVAVLALAGPRLAGSPDVLFYGGFPLIAVAVASVRGAGWAWGTASLLAITTVSRTGLDGFVGIADAVSDVVTYLVGAVLFPWIVGALRTFDRRRRDAESEALDERGRRARAEERAELSARLHDSVLQTLALIQRRADRSDEVASLARRQERDLRTWLFGSEAFTDGSLASAVRDSALEVEELAGGTVDLVVSGDTKLDDAANALVAAGREAMLNALRHSGSQSVSVYAEVEDQRIRMWVRDRGCGFDPAVVPIDRGGIAGSIIGRIRRVGGTAEIRSGAGRGTEVELVVPR